MSGNWIAGLRADPCRIIRALFDWRSIWRMYRQLRTHGLKVLRTELGADLPAPAPDPGNPALASESDVRSEGQKTMLVIDRCIPLYDRDAGSRSSFQYLQLFRDLGFRVFFLPHDQIIREPYATKLRELGVEILAGKGVRCSGWKTWLSKHASLIDFIVLYRPNIAREYLDFARMATNARIFYFGVDLRFWREQRRYAIEGDRFHRSEAAYWKRIELELCRKADVSYFYSDAESQSVVQSVPGANVRTVPLFLEREDETGHDPPFAERKDILFVGNFAHTPNIDAIEWFVSQCWPLVRNSLPEGIRLTIVGANPPTSVASLADRGITVCGAVSDKRLRMHYEHARVVVVPLRYGAGVKGKVVEALQRGLPVVTTTIGAEGIPACALILADAPEDFAVAVCSLSTDEQAWNEARHKAQTAAAQHFSRQRAHVILAASFHH